MIKVARLNQRTVAGVQEEDRGGPLSARYSSIEALRARDCFHGGERCKYRKLRDASMSSVIYVQCENFCSYRYSHPSSPSALSLSLPLVPFAPCASCSLRISLPLRGETLQRRPRGEKRRRRREPTEAKQRDEGERESQQEGSKGETVTCLY